MGLLTGLRIYFDKALPKLLLYRQERDQWDVAKDLHHQPSQIYGAEHLVRLFVRLPKLVAQVSLTQSELNQTMSKFMELLNFVQKHSEIYISKTEYVARNTSLEHVRRCVQTVYERNEKNEGGESSSGSSSSSS